MRVKCAKCNKKYDKEIYSGICPRCGTFYNRQDLGKPSGMQPIKPVPKKEKTKKEKHKKDTPEADKFHPFKSKLNIFLLLLVILFPLAGFCWAKYNNYQEIKKRINKEPVSPVLIEMNKPFSCEMSEVDYCEISITGAQVDRDEQLDLPDGYEMLVVSYEVHTPITDEESEYTENLSDYHCFDIEPYLFTSEGYYLEPVSPYEVKEMKKMGDEEYRECGVSTALSYRKGSLYYLIKQGDTCGLWITQYEEEDTYDGDFHYVASYQLKQLEVTR